MAFSQETYRGCQKDKKYVRDQSKLLIDCKNIYQQSTRKTNMPFLKAELNPTSFSFITTGLFTVCQGSDPFYIVKLLYKMGHYFLNRLYVTSWGTSTTRLLNNQIIFFLFPCLPKFVIYCARGNGPCKVTKLQGTFSGCAHALRAHYKLLVK